MKTVLASVAYACDPCTLEAEARGLRVEVNLGFIARPCLQKHKLDSDFNIKVIVLYTVDSQKLWILKNCIQTVLSTLIAVCLAWCQVYPTSLSNSLQLCDKSILSCYG
jgi:hypothetical protein